MRIFLAGATGVIGRPLVRQLVEANHDVWAMTRSEGRADSLQAGGAMPVVCNAFDRERLRRRVASTRPDVVIHQLTALPKRIDPRKMNRQLAATYRLRDEGTRNLFEAGRVAGAQRFIAQSIAFTYEPDGDGLKTEDDPLFENPPRAYADVVRAIQSLERITVGSPDITGVVLRYGFFYGPGTAYAADGAIAEEVRRRLAPIAGKGSGVFSFIHVEDAAAATVAAVERGEAGIYNIVDDEPAPVAEWLPIYAKALAAPPPRHVPRWLVRAIAGSYATYLLCDQRGASNAKAKRLLDWSPRHSTWRIGFARMDEPQEKVAVTHEHAT